MPYIRKDNNTVTNKLVYVSGPPGSQGESGPQGPQGPGGSGSDFNSANITVSTDGTLGVGALDHPNLLKACVITLTSSAVRTIHGMLSDTTIGNMNPIKEIRNGNAPGGSDFILIHNSGSAASAKDRFNITESSSYTIRPGESVKFGGYDYLSELWLKTADSTLVDGELASVLATRIGKKDGEVRRVSGVGAVGVGNGPFRWFSGDSTPANGGTVIGVGSGRWKREYSGPINARWFGGSANATRINSAIDAAVALGGGTVIVPKEAYTVTGMAGDRILPKSNVELIFEPGCTISTGPISGTSFVFFVDASAAPGIENVCIRGNGLVVTGSISAGFTHVQYLFAMNYQAPATYFRNVRVSDIVLDTSPYDGFIAAGNVGLLPENVILERVTCTNCLRCGGSEINASGLKYFDCHFDFNGHGGREGDPRTGIDIEVDNAPAGHMVNKDSEYVRCTFNGNYSHGALVQAPPFGVTRGYRFVDSEASDNGASGFVSNAPDAKLTRCRAERNTLQGFHIEPDTVLENCLSRSNGGDGLRVQASGNRVDIHGFVSEFNGGNGMLINTLGGARGVVNVVAPTVRGNLGSGIYLSGANNIKLLDGVVELNQNEGIRVRVSNHCLISDMTVAQNGCALDAVVDNILVDVDSAHCAVLSNVIRECTSYFRGNAVGAGSAAGAVKLAAHAGKRGSLEYVNGFMRVLSGLQAGQSSWISAYDEVTQTVTLQTALSGAPDDTSVIEIVGGFLDMMSVVSATAATVTVHEDAASSVDNSYHGTLVCVSGTGAGQRVPIASYDGGTRVFTMGDNFSPVLDDTSVVVVVVNNRPRYGIRIEASAHGTYLRDNDVYHGGITGQISDVGVGTDSAGNRTV